MMDLRNRGLAAAISAPFFIAVAIIVVKQAGTHVSPLVISALGSLMSVPMLFTYHSLRGSRLSIRLLLTRYRGAFLRILFSRTICGQVFIVAGFAMTSAVKAVLLLRLEPLFVLLWAVIAGTERFCLRKLSLMLVLLVGAALVVAPNSISVPNVGDALIVISLVFLSYSYGPTDTAVNGAGAPALTISLSGLGGLFLAVVAVIAGGWHSLLLSPQNFELLAIYSFVFFLVANSLYFFAFKSLRPWLISALLSLEVVFGVGLAVVWLHESISLLQIVGCGIVIGATLVIARLNNSATSATPAPPIDDAAAHPDEYTGSVKAAETEPV